MSMDIPKAKRLGNGQEYVREYASRQTPVLSDRSVRTGTARDWIAPAAGVWWITRHFPRRLLDRACQTLRPDDAPL